MRKMSSKAGVSLPKASAVVRQPWLYSTTDLPGSMDPVVKQTVWYETLKELSVECTEKACQSHTAEASFSFGTGSLLNQLQSLVIDKVSKRERA